MIISQISPKIKGFPLAKMPPKKYTIMVYFSKVKFSKAKQEEIIMGLEMIDGKYWLYELVYNYMD